MESLSFDNLTEYYDKTRDYDIASFNEAINYIANRYPSSKYPSLFEPGIGSGRIAIPLAEKGYKITGIDISNKMIEILKKKISKQNSLDIKYQVADTTDIPFPSNSFNISVIVHLFYFIKHWEKAVDEIVRVVKGPIIILHTGMGQEIPFLNQKYKDICRDLNSPIINLGVNSTNEVLDYLKRSNCDIETVENDWKWTSKVNLFKAYEYIKNRAYSFTHLVPEGTHNKAVNILLEYLESSYAEINNDEIEVDNCINLTVVTKSK